METELILAILAALIALGAVVATAMSIDRLIRSIDGQIAKIAKNAE
jgi:hypothetical protein